MSPYALALQAEATGNHYQAITWYEEAIRQPAPPLATFTNLAFLYWFISWDFGMETAFVQAHPGTEPLVLQYATRWPALLAEACQRFPDEPEPPYWQAYLTEEATYTNEPDPFLLVELPARWPTCLLPELYCFQHGLAHNQQAIDQLYKLVCHGQTQKSSWLTHTIDSLRSFEALRRWQVAPS